MSSDFSSNLNNSMFVTCSETWDENLKKFKPSSSAEMLRCCLDDCIEPVKKCHEYCIDHAKTHEQILDDCLEACDLQRKFCIDTCRNSSDYVGMKSNYFNCANEYGCLGLEGIPDEECIKQNKDIIFECCRDNCIPSSNVDCQQNCELIESILLDNKNIGIPKSADLNINKSSQELINGKKSSNMNIAIPIVSLVSLALIIALLFLLRRI